MAKLASFQFIEKNYLILFAENCIILLIIRIDNDNEESYSKYPLRKNSQSEVYQHTCTYNSSPKMAELPSLKFIAKNI